MALKQIGPKIKYVEGIDRLDTVFNWHYFMEQAYAVSRMNRCFEKNK